jgi:hypothetical protein
VLESGLMTPKAPPTPPKRAPKGSIGGSADDPGPVLLVRVPADVKAAVHKAAHKAGVAVAEWVREAIKEKLGK